MWFNWHSEVNNLHCGIDRQSKVKILRKPSLPMIVSTERIRSNWDITQKTVKWHNVNEETQSIINKL